MSKEQKVTGNIQPPNKDLEILKQNFPSCFDKNGDFDFEKFKTKLSKNEINFSKESYGMDWLGKSYARLLATDETTTLLKEDETFNKKDENKNSENLLIKGDNLEVLKHLSNAYYEKVKMIYIDPPYNTGSDGFVYADDRKFTIDELQELAGVNEERAKRILDFTQSKSNSHSAWLTFMYPRLYIAKQLLKEDGVIFVSIDDNEVAQLRLLMDDIFGEDNTEIYIWNLSDFEESSFTKTASNTVRRENEYIVAAYKKEKKLGRYKEYRLINRDDLSNIDDDPRGDWFSGNISRNGIKTTTGSKYFTITTPTGIEYSRNWTVSKDEFQELLKDNRIYFSKDGDGVPRLKKFKNEPSFSIQSSIFSDCKTSISGKNRIKDLFNDKTIFDFPKPTEIIERLITLTCSDEKNDLILDFFAGSGTTGDAVMQLNAEDGGNRKFILAQLPELIDQKSNKTAYDFVKNELKVEEPTIFDITKERLIRASKKIQEDNKDKDLSNQDLGFKVFETMPIWEDYNFESEELEKQTSLFDESKLTKEDIRALLVTWKTYDAVPLTTSIQEIDLNGYTAHYSSEKLYLMNKGFTTKNLKTLLEKIDSDKNFNPTTIIAFGYHFESKNLREISENIKSYANKKSIDIDFITRY